MALGTTTLQPLNRIEDGYHLIANQPDRFGMLFCDFHFPSGVTGGELLRRLSNEQRLQNVVAFLITSEPTVDNVKEARQAGAVGVVAKPFDRDELERQLDKAERNFQLNEGESF
jgi:CheY-like chemotaxis protein